jgi:hypothetical protein
MARNSDDIQRKCKKCNEEKPLSSFVKNPQCREGRTHECYSCRSDYMNGIYKEQSYNTKRKHMLKRSYGISLEDYNEMFLKQEGCCAICNKHQSEIEDTLNVDHDHVTGKVRGLLCRKCNTGIGLLQDDFYILLSAAHYIQENK